MSVVDGLIAGMPLSGSPLAVGLVIVAGLLGVRAVRRRIHGSGHAGERLLILGESRLGRQIVEEIGRRPQLRTVIAGVVADARNVGRIIDTTRPDRIVVALAERRGRLPLYPLLESRARGILVEDAAETYERLTGRLALEALSPSSVIFSRRFQASRLHRVASRVLGLVAALVGLILLAPVLGLIVLLIKLDSRGPALFVQERIGLCGRPFRLLKFRTMRPVSRPTSEWERDNCDRITRVGNWLRRFRLDELPQLVNVLRGDMNLVGPRPHPTTNLALITLAARNLSQVSGDAIPYYSLRCSVRPGITGWAQVRYGYANSLEEEMEKICYDLYYLKHMSLWLDLRILAETAGMLLTGRGGASAADRRGQRAVAERLGHAA